MVDALRVIIGLRPLYDLDTRTSSTRWALGLMQIGIGDGNRRTPSTSSSDRSKAPDYTMKPELPCSYNVTSRAARRRKSRGMVRGQYTLAGHRVGRSFVTMGGKL